MQDNHFKNSRNNVTTKEFNGKYPDEYSVLIKEVDAAFDNCNISLEWFNSTYKTWNILSFGVEVIGKQSYFFSITNGVVFCLCDGAVGYGSTVNEAFVELTINNKLYSDSSLKAA